MTTIDWVERTAVSKSVLSMQMFLKQQLSSWKLPVVAVDRGHKCLAVALIEEELFVLRYYKRLYKNLQFLFMYVY